MTESAERKPNFTNEQALRLWATYIKRWGELLHDRVMADAERCEVLDSLDQAYLRAFWQGLTSKLNRINTEPLSVPAETQEALDSMWNTIALQFGFIYSLVRRLRVLHG